MKFAILLTLLVAAFAAPQGYDLGAPSGAGLSAGLGGIGSAGGVGSAAGAGSSDGSLVAGDGAIGGCREGEVLHVDGTCVVPEVNRKVYVFDVPEQERPVAPSPSLPPPAVDHNILFVRLPEEGPGPDPIVIPPPKQNNIVYVLNKQEDQVQRVIEVPAQPQADPEIYFVNYQDGENPSLPLGVDLETALAAASAAGGQVLGGDGREGGLGGTVGGVSGVGGLGGGVGVTNGQNGFGGGVGLNGGHGGNGFGIVNGGGVGVGVNGVTGSRPSGIYSTP